MLQIEPRDPAVHNSELLERAGIAHELGNLIQTASSAMNILARSAPMQGAAGIEPVLSGARASLDRAGSLVRQTLLRAMQAEAKPQTVDVHRCLADVERVVLYSWPAGIGVRLSMRSGPARVACDPLALHNAI